MDLAEYVDLKTSNTMRLPCIARYVLTAHTEADLDQALTHPLLQQYPLVVLGGGSNVLLPDQLQAVVLRPQLKGVRVLAQDDQWVSIQVMAGEIWPQFVQYTLAQGWYGLENLSLIPGTVGACPIQNVGAYGVEVGDYLTQVRAYHLPTQTWHTLRHADCQFAYRDSLFKQQANQWLISHVVFRLRLIPAVKVDYGDVRALAGESPTPQQVADAIIQIRQSKLPDPSITPNTGSFFKNPVISDLHYQQLKAQYPSLAGHAQADGGIKVAAGWLIDQAGWKGRKMGRAQVYPKQALVLTNPDDGTRLDIEQLSGAIMADVQAKFGISLEREPVWLLSDGSIGAP
jgi:UDP-N-acetylmuramate dehydrogenase